MKPTERMREKNREKAGNVKKKLKISTISNDLLIEKGKKHKYLEGKKSFANTKNTWGWSGMSEMRY